MIYYVGQKFQVVNSTPLYNGKIVTIYSLKPSDSPSRLHTVKLPDGSLQQFMSYQLKEIKPNMLKEDYGESDELDTFVSQANNKFRSYYVVYMRLDGTETNRYFAFKAPAQEYYDKLVDEANKNKEYYDGADIQLNKINVELNIEELENTLVDVEGENFSIGTRDDMYDTDDSLDDNDFEEINKKIKR